MSNLNVTMRRSASIASTIPPTPTIIVSEPPIHSPVAETAEEHIRKDLEHDRKDAEHELNRYEDAGVLLEAAERIISLGFSGIQNFPTVGLIDGIMRANLEALPGFGEMKVTSMGAVLAKRFGVAIAEPLVPWHPTLGDVDSPQALADYQATKRAHKKEWAKAHAPQAAGA